MRDLKFRIWNQEYEQMLYCKPVIQEYDFEDGIVLSFPPDGYSGFWGHECYDKRKPHVEVMQYTERKDKNGKEIYDGDVCRAFDPDVDCSENKLIVFNEHCGQWFWGNDGGNSIALWELDPDCIEVIGNIYENPELLK